MDPRPTTLAQFAALVRASPHNLVSRRDRGHLHERHLAESVAVADRIPAGTRRLLDVGSGGGFPGFVIAVMRPEIEVHLLDSIRKKTDFLAESAARLHVDLQIHTGRAEELATGTLGSSFDLVTARAVAPLPALLALTMPYLRLGGHLYAIKGARWREELAAATCALARHGATVVETPVGGDGPGAGPMVVIIERTA